MPVFAPWYRCYAPTVCAETESFEEAIAPLIQTRCLECHDGSGTVGFSALQWRGSLPAWFD